MSLLYALLIGAIVGWLAGKIMRGGGFGLVLNIVIGIVGCFVGNWAFSALGVSISSGLIGDIITGTIGAIIILFMAGLFKK